MKKNTLFGLGLLFVVAALSSCGKSTTGKITNNWKIVVSEEERNYVNFNGDKSSQKISFTETTIFTHSESTPTGGSTGIDESSGKVSANTIDIKKDGTWTWNQEIYYEGDQGGVQVNTNLKNVQSGTWNFVAKTKGDDFKKNERIALNILDTKNSVYQTQDQAPVADHTNSNTFLPGENMLIYTIVKSKGKELQLKLVESYQSKQNGETSTRDITQNMTLKEK